MKNKAFVAEDHDENRVILKYFHKLKNLKTILQTRDKMKSRRNQAAQKHRLNKIFIGFKSQVQRQIYYSKKFNTINEVRVRNCEKYYFRILIQKYALEKKG